VPSVARSRWPRAALALVGLALLALVVHTVFGEHGYLALRRQRQTLEQLEKEIERLEEENRRLAAEIEALKKDPREIERVAREQLKMARPGEKVVTLPEKPPAETDNKR
jgi:cell division protein FtsB